MESKTRQGQIIIEFALILFTFSLLLLLVVDFRSPTGRKFINGYQNKKTHAVKSLQKNDFSELRLRHNRSSHQNEVKND